MNRKFELKEQTEEYLFGLHVKCGFYFDRIFAGNEEGFERYSALFEQLEGLCKDLAVLLEIVGTRSFGRRCSRTTPSKSDG